MARKTRKEPDIAPWAKPYYERLRVRPGGMTTLSERSGLDPSTVYRHLRLPERDPKAAYLRQVADAILAEPPAPRERAKTSNRPVADSAAVEAVTLLDQAVRMLAEARSLIASTTGYESQRRVMPAPTRGSADGERRGEG